MLVGTAEILIVPSTAGFEEALKAKSDASFGQFKNDAETAGEDAGAGLRTGVGKESSKLAGDMEKDGAKAGEGLHKGMSGPLSKLASLISNTGLPLGGLSTGLEKAGVAAEDSGGKAEGFGQKLSHVGGIAAAGLAGGLLVAGAAAVDVGEKMQSADAAIAAASGTSTKAASAIGTAFEGTAFKSEFSSVEMAKAFASVAGQLKATQGSALNSSQAMSVMTASSDLATAKQIDLATATSTVAGVMQAFQIKAAGAAHVSDVLFSASAATGQSVDTLGASLEKVRSKMGAFAPPVGQLGALLLDMTKHGETGRAAMSALGSMFTGLIPPTGKLTTAQAAIVDLQKKMGLTFVTSTGQMKPMRDIIAEVAPQIAGMGNAQAVATLKALGFGSASEKLLTTIKAGPAAYDNASMAVNKHGAAADAAAKQSKTLGVEVKTLEAGFIDLAGKIGAVLIPIVTAMIGRFIQATTFVTGHKAVLIALAAVVTGILGPAITVFAINKMATFGQSFITAGGHVKDFASGVQAAVSKVIGLFTQQNAASDAATTKLATNSAKGSTAVAGEATEIGVSSGTIETDQAAVAGSFDASATAAQTAEAKVGTAVAGEAGAVTAADGTIEADNAVAGASFTALLGPIGLAAAAVAGLAAGANKIVKATGGTPNPTGSFNAGGGGGASGTSPGQQSGQGTNILGVHIGGPGGALLKTLGVGTNIEAAAINRNTSSVDHLTATITPLGGAASVTSMLKAAPAAKAATAFQLPTNATGPALINDIIGYGQSIHATMKQIMAAVETALVEQPALDNGPYGSGTSVGWRQETSGSYGAAVAPRLDLQKTIPAFYSEEKSGDNAGTPGQLAQSVQRSAYPGRYDQEAGAATARIAAAGLVTTGSSGTGPSASQLAATKLAAERIKLAAEIAKEATATAKHIAQLEGTLKPKVHKTTTLDADGHFHTKTTTTHATPDQRAEVGGQVADLKAGLSIQVAQQKAALEGQTAAQKSELSKQTGDEKGAATQMGKLVAAIHSGKLSDLKTALIEAHNAHLTNIEHELDHDHSSALASLSKELVAVHAKAMADFVKQSVAAVKAVVPAVAAVAASASTATDPTAQANAVIADTAKASADSIADSTKVYLDQQAAVGLTGAALTAANAQTSLDSVTASSNAAIDAAQTAVDQASSGSVEAQDNAATQLAQAQAAATVNEAQAQSVLDKASAAATAAGSSTSSSSSVVNIGITGGPYSPSQIASEITWAMTIGALPTATVPAAPVPA